MEHSQRNEASLDVRVYTIRHGLSDGFDAAENTTVTGITLNVDHEARDEPVDVLEGFQDSHTDTVKDDPTHCLAEVAADLHDVEGDVGIGPAGRVPVVFWRRGHVQELGLVGTKPAKRGKGGDHEGGESDLSSAALSHTL